MSNRKQQKEIDKAIHHLLAYPAQNDVWAQRLEEAMSQMLVPVAQTLNMDDDQLKALLVNGPYGHMAFGYIFEDFATSVWDDDKGSLIDDYLKRRGWREGAAGRRYLKAMSDSSVKLWEITNVKTGAYADVRPYGTQDKPIRVKEKSATKDLHKWDCLAGRVLRMDGSHIFSGALLPLPATEAARVERVIDKATEDLIAMTYDLKKSGEIDDLPDNFEQLAADDAREQSPEILFRIWGVYVCQAESRPTPQLHNMDGEPILLSRLRFPIVGEAKNIIQALNDAPLLDRCSDDMWTWLPVPAKNIVEGEQVNILGHVFLRESSVELEVNSIERAENGKKLMRETLGSLVGNPMTVHENLDHMLQAGMDEGPATELADSEEGRAMTKSFLDQHYLRVLDEPVPMLNDKTPRECAKNPELQNDVIQWLKHLENQSQHAPPPAYDFSWMWDELNL